MRILETWRFLWRTTAFVVGTVVCWLSFELAMLCRGKRPALDVINTWVPRWARLMLWVYSIRVDAQGEYTERGEVYPGGNSQGVGRVFVANHRSALDIPIILSVAAAHVISRHDLANWPLIGRSAKRVGTLFVDRDSKRSGASVLKAVNEALGRGEGVAMFPEGTAHDGDEVREFRPGAFNAARRAGAEIVPIGMAYGSDEAYYGKRPFMAHIYRVSVLKELHVALDLGKPLEVGERSSIEIKDLARQEVQALVDRARARLTAKNGK